MITWIPGMWKKRGYKIYSVRSCMEPFSWPISMSKVSVKSRKCCCFLSHCNPAGCMQLIGTETTWMCYGSWQQCHTAEGLRVYWKCWKLTCSHGSLHPSLYRARRAVAFTTPSRWGNADSVRATHKRQTGSDLWDYIYNLTRANALTWTSPVRTNTVGSYC